MRGAVVSSRIMEPCRLEGVRLITRLHPVRRLRRFIQVLHGRKMRAPTLQSLPAEFRGSQTWKVGESRHREESEGWEWDLKSSCIGFLAWLSEHQLHA
ncbi:hypothetical protein K437DRAFT_152586 [Tilletiaria anomala UBC 951]|uniref:Uncharacterized protein n=1 Tax=Tilletiaria anomala (strain ATCC 24038 / CBS 436.72 / UBC 951) TaxID=1037660 RepID=A0A066VY27_TILAU|nr:uncharacterized protein K437DRAFT_152586 [Tilletiaria anomala UBC 951]KDN43430.1 hypothetical protein K437DRAFT_152586 [Tilletiaria anomala UBC 951]